MEDVIIYGLGLVCASACAADHLTPDEVAERVNGAHPTGITSRWAVSEDGFFDGTPNPNPCADHPGRVHYLLEC